MNAARDTGSATLRHGTRSGGRPKIKYPNGIVVMLLEFIFTAYKA